MRAAQQYRQMFRRIGIKDSTHLALDSLLTADTLLTDPADIHTALTDHFAAWYRVPSTTHAFAEHLQDPTWIDALLQGTASPDPTLPPSFRCDYHQACLSRLGAPQPSPHAYRRGMGTGTAILRLLNLVEDSTETNSALLVTAWDIKRAFDSIPHPFIRLALLRLGISEDVADWFQHLLSHNIVTHHTP